MTDCCIDNFNLCIAQGTTYVKVFTWFTLSCCGHAVGSQYAPVDITGYTAAMQIRAYPLSGVLYDATADLTLGGPAGTITLSIPAADTENFTWWNGVYDIVLTSPGGTVSRFVQGTVSVSPGVTT